MNDEPTRQFVGVAAAVRHRAERHVAGVACKVSEKARAELGAWWPARCFSGVSRTRDGVVCRLRHVV